MKEKSNNFRATDNSSNRPTPNEVPENRRKGIKAIIPLLMATLVGWGIVSHQADKQNKPVDSTPAVTTTPTHESTINLDELNDLESLKTFSTYVPTSSPVEVEENNESLQPLQNVVETLTPVQEISLFDEVKKKGQPSVEFNILHGFLSSDPSTRRDVKEQNYKTLCTYILNKIQTSYDVNLSAYEAEAFHYNFIEYAQLVFLDNGNVAMTIELVYPIAADSGFVDSYFIEIDFNAADEIEIVNSVPIVVSVPDGGILLNEDEIKEKFASYRGVEILTANQVSYHRENPEYTLSYAGDTVVPPAFQPLIEPDKEEYLMKKYSVSDTLNIPYNYQHITREIFAFQQQAGHIDLARNGFDGYRGSGLMGYFVDATTQGKDESNKEINPVIE